MNLSQLENSIFDDVVQDSHELWEWYVFVRYDSPALPEDDVIRRGKDLISSWANRGWLHAVASRTDKNVVTASALIARVEELGSTAADPHIGRLLLSLTPRALSEIAKAPTFSEGKRYVNPDVLGEIVRAQSGFSSASDLIRQGPYAKITKNGKSTYTALAGNPVLNK